MYVSVLFAYMSVHRVHALWFQSPEECWILLEAELQMIVNTM